VDEIRAHAAVDALELAADIPSPGAVTDNGLDIDSVSTGELRCRPKQVFVARRDHRKRVRGPRAGSTVRTHTIALERSKREEQRCMRA
jgi:hypothetical protein